MSENLKNVFSSQCVPLVMDLLIELVRERKVLYDTKCREYRDQTMKMAAWEEIAQILSEPVNKCKEDWTKLRNAFASALKRRRNKKSGQAAAGFVPWKHEKAMSFLLPYIECRLTKTNVMSPPESPVDDPFESGTISAGSSCSYESFGTRSSLASGEPNKKQKLEDLLDLMKSSQELRRQKLACKQDMDETDLFFLSMSKAVKKLPKPQQTKIKLNLLTAISQAEVEQLEGKDNIIPSPVNILSQQVITPPQQDQLSVNIEAPADLPPPLYSQSSPTTLLSTNVPSTSNIKTYYENIDYQF